jgi:hypothetical protein
MQPGDALPSLTHKFQLGDQANGGLEGYFIVTHDAGAIRRLDIFLNKPGSLERGMATAMQELFNLALSRGVPLADILGTLRGMKFEPAGRTGGRAVPFADSFVDYLARWIEGHEAFSQEQKTNAA